MTFRDVPLRPHARDGAGPVRALSVSGTLHRSGRLVVEFQLDGELRAIRIEPSRCQARRRDELWRHSCFELFARRDGEPGYCEYNFSPGGDWAAYQFDDYRGTRRDANQRAPEVHLHTSGISRITLRARCDLRAAFADLPPPARPAPWRLNCAAVIEASDGSLGYWAISHPRPQPDFHDAAGFGIVLVEPQTGGGSEDVPA